MQVGKRGPLRKRQKPGQIAKTGQVLGPRWLCLDHQQPYRAQHKRGSISRDTLLLEWDKTCWRKPARVIGGDVVPWLLQKNTADVATSAVKMERVKGLEPSISAWKANVLPLHYTRMPKFGDWCGRRDSNSYTLRHRNLNPTRLPIPPRPHSCRKKW